MHTMDCDKSGMKGAPMNRERLRLEMALLALATEEKTPAGFKEIAGMYAVMLEDKESCRVLLLLAEDLAASVQDLYGVAEAWITFLEDKDAAERCRRKAGMLFQGVP
jgi:hypothetical protein